MCRLYGFRSSITSGIHQSLVAADNALAHQSHRHPDGWGLAYYHDRYPHLIRNDQEAHSDKLFSNLTGVVRTETLIAHVRQASVGEVDILNCHPFQFGPWAFAHNGEIGGYARESSVREAIVELVDPRFRGYILGSTDSEVCFYIFLSRLARKVDDIAHVGVSLDMSLEALRETSESVRELADDSHEQTRLTFLLTNGSLLIGTRFKRELNFSTYKTQCPERETCHAFNQSRCEAEVRDGLVNHLIITSEEITGTNNVWTELEDGEYVAVNHGMRFRRGKLADY